jgi:hypothetical protein
MSTPTRHGSCPPRVARSALVLLLALAATLTHSQEVARGAVAPLPVGFVDALKTPLNFYPGETLHLEIDGSVDASHRFWREKKCSWFGLSCSWHQRNQANWVEPASLPLQLRFSDQSDQTPTSPAHEPITQPDTNTASSAYFFKTRLEPLALASEQRTWSNARTPYRLLGRLPDQLSRASCSPAPSDGSCSQGQYVVILRRVDVGERLRILTDLLRERRSVNELLSPHFIDQNIRAQQECDNAQLNSCDNGLAPAGQASRLILRHAGQFSFTNAERRQLYEFALDLDSKNPDARNQLTALLIKTGDIGQAKLESQKSLAQLQNEYRAASGSPTTELVCRFGLALTNSAKVWLADRVGTQPSDVATAAQLYEDAINEYKAHSPGVCTDTGAPTVTAAEPGAVPASSAAPTPAAEPAPNEIPTSEDTLEQRMVDAQIDRARVLGLLRTRSALKQAAVALEEARDTVLAIEKATNRPPPHVPFETRPAQNPEPVLTSHVRNFDAPGRLLSVRTSSIANAVIVLSSAPPNTLLWRSSDQTSSTLILEGSCAPNETGGVQILEGASADLSAFSVLVSSATSAGARLGLYSKQRCTELKFDAPIVVGVSNEKIVTVDAKHPLVFDTTKLKSATIQIFDPGQPENPSEFDIPAAQNAEAHGNPIAVQLSGDNLAGMVLTDQTNKLHLLHANLKGPTPPQWNLMCTLDLRLPISKLALSRDLTAVVWVDSSGAVFAARVRSTVSANRCEDFTQSLSAMGLSVPTLAILPLGQNGFALFDPVAPRAGNSAQVLQLAPVSAPATPGAQPLEPRWKLIAVDVPVPAQPNWTLLTNAQDGELSVVRGPATIR